MKRFSKNFLMILLSDVGRRFFGFLALAYLTRKISVDDFGAVNIGLTLLSYGLMLSSGGLSSFGAREVVRNDDPKIVNGILTARFFNAVIVYGLICVGSFFLIVNPLSRMLTVIFSISLMVNAFYVDWYFQGRESMQMIGVSRLASGVVYLLVILIAVKTPADIFWIPVAAIFSDITVTALLYKSYKRIQPAGKFTFRPVEWIPLMKKSLPIGAGSMLAHFSINLPPILLGIILSNNEVGKYSAASKLVFFLLILDRVIATLLLPASTRFYAVSKQALATTLQTAMKWMIVIALPMSVGGSILADKILPVVFGTQYVVAAGCFRILIWYFFFTILHTAFSTGLVAIDQEKLFGRFMLMSAIIYAVAVTVGIYLGGVTGAAIGVVVSEALTVILMGTKFLKFIPLRIPLSVFRSVMAVILMGAVLLLFPSLHLVLSVVTGVVIYSAAIYLFKAITMTDIAELVKRV